MEGRCFRTSYVLGSRLVFKSLYTIWYYQASKIKFYYFKYLKCHNGSTWIMRCLSRAKQELFKSQSKVVTRPLVYHLWISNEGLSGGSFCCQLAAWFPVMFCNFYLEKNYIIAKNSTIFQARQKIRIDWESLEFHNFLVYVWLHLRTMKFYLLN